MIQSRKLMLALAVSLLFTTPSFADTIPATKITQKATVTAPQLIKGNWDSFNRDQINKMIARHANTNPNFDPANPAYVVFDWDNTSVFLDIQEALLIYQIEHLRYNMPPETMDKVLRMNIPTDNFDASLNNKAGKPVNIDLIAQDIVSNYTWIYNNFDQMQGTLPLAEIRNTEQYQEFSAKLRYLYEAIGSSFDHSVSYPWVTYHFTGLTEKAVRALAAETMEWQSKEPIELVTWVSPAIESKAGQVEVTWNNGVRSVPEVQDLYAKLREAGIDVYVCSASFIDVIKEVSSNPKFGYNNPEANVIAMELERDADGVILPEFRKGYNQTQGPGKTVEIKRLIAPKYNNRGPILVATDSEGDQNMIQDFKETEVGIINNRLRSPDTDIGKFSIEAVKTYKDPQAKYLLQGRDENTGLYIPSQQMRKIGETQLRTLKGE